MAIGINLNDEGVYRDGDELKPLAKTQAEMAALAAKLKAEKRQCHPALAAIGQEIRESIRDEHDRRVVAAIYMRHKMKPCICTTNEAGERIDRDGLPLWHKMEGCPKCDPLVYTPNITPTAPRKS